MTSPSQNIVKVGMIFISKLTKLRRFNIKNGLSKKYEYLQIEGVPAKVRSVNPEGIELNSLTSSTKRCFFRYDRGITSRVHSSNDHRLKWIYSLRKISKRTCKY